MSLGRPSHARPRAAAWLLGLVALVGHVGCPQGERRTGPPVEPTADRGSPGDAAGQASETAPDAAPSVAAPDAVAPALRCALVGATTRLRSVAAADVTAGPRGPVVFAIVSRPRSEPLALEGDSRLPELRSLYAIETAGAEAPTARHLLDDPGPVRDEFGRMAYERLALVRAACDARGCLVAAAVARQTPGTAGSAFTVQVLVLDDALAPQESPTRLAQEPDRGERLSACAGLSDEGFLLATAVEAGRGRVLWLDRAATPLGADFLPGGFASCATSRAGLRVRLVTVGPGGAAVAEFGSEPAAEGQAPRLEPPSGTGAATLVAAESGHVLLAASGGAVEARAEGRQARTRVFDGDAAALSAARSGEDVVAVALLGGRLAAARLGPGLEVAARSTDLAEADAAWVVATEDLPAVAWTSGATLALGSLGCGELPAREEPDRPVEAASLEAADRRDAPALASMARAATSDGQSYRAAWLLERAYDLDGADPSALRDAAALLTELRYTQAARRVLTRLSKLGGAESEALVRSTCRDAAFERQWASGEFQKITGCAAPRPGRTEPDAGEPDAGVAQDAGRAAERDGAADSTPSR